MEAAGGAAGPSPAASCACTNIAIVQLFHELKQQFPTVPDHVVSGAIASSRHDRDACRRRLEREARALAARSYPIARRASGDGDEASSHTSNNECPNASPPAVNNNNHNNDNTTRPRRPDDLPLVDAGRLRFDVRSSPGGESQLELNVTVRTPTSARRGVGNVQITVGAQYAEVGGGGLGSGGGGGGGEARLRKQRARLERLRSALGADRARLASVRREVRTLRAPPPPPPLVGDLRRSVQRLHAHCQRLAEQLDDATHPLGGDRCGSSSRPVSYEESHRAATEEPPSDWRCHVCTYENRPSLNKCEMCEMPRIILGRANDDDEDEPSPAVGRELFSPPNS